MSLFEKNHYPGEHKLLFPGKQGALEGMMTVPEIIRHDYIALLGHPHPLQGGTMNNKVVTTLARSFKELGVISLRFNFPGAGLSQGVYDHGLGESDDMLLLLDAWKKEKGNVRVFLAGFSFGSYVAYRVAAQHQHELLITIAPPVHHYDYHAFQPPPNPWVIFQGDEDEVVEPSLVFDFAKQSTPPLPVVRFEHTGHFFHGKLILLKEKLTQQIQRFIQT